MEEHEARVLMAAVIEQAVHDRRTAVTRGLVDARGRLLVDAPPHKSETYGVTFALEPFFYSGGLELCMDMAGFKTCPDLIRRKSCERY